MSQSILSPEDAAGLVEFARRLVQIQSPSGHEEEIIRFVEQHMLSLGYEEVVIDRMGNVMGRIGTGGRILQFDSHVDTVAVTDAEAWAVPPFSGTVIDGILHGRGSVDMKSGAAASIYAAALAARSGLIDGKTVIVTCTVYEEDCDGENLKYLYGERNIRPDAVVICEPSDNTIVLGHKGKAQITIQTHGISAHGSAPEKGLNAIYEMADIIQRVEALNASLQHKGRPCGTVVMSQISSVSASLNAVPSECEVYLDRRMVSGETVDDIRGEMDALVAGRRATWQVGAIQRTSWTGHPITYEPLHPAWQIEHDHPLTAACRQAYADVFGSTPDRYDFWDFSTNAVTPVSMGIPVIGFGPGEYKLAHMRDERCPIAQIIDAAGFYLRLIERF